MGMQSSERSSYIGANVKPGVKVALEKESQTEGGSVSRLISDIIEAEMVARGYNVDVLVRITGEQPLPLDKMPNNETGAEPPVDPFIEGIQNRDN